MRVCNNRFSSHYVTQKYNFTCVVGIFILNKWLKNNRNIGKKLKSPKEETNKK